jgi:hypothetical protein
MLTAKNFKVDVQFVPRPLQEINEVDELQGNNNENYFQGMSDGNNSSQNRHSPITQKGM